MPCPPWHNASRGTPYWLQVFGLEASLKKASWFAREKTANREIHPAKPAGWRRTGVPRGALRNRERLWKQRDFKWLCFHNLSQVL